MSCEGRSLTIGSALSEVVATRYLDRVASIYGGPGVEPEDVKGEVAVKLLTAFDADQELWEHFYSKRHFKAYLATMTRNVALNLRRENVRGFLALESVPEEWFGEQSTTLMGLAIEELVSSLTDPEAAMLRAVIEGGDAVVEGTREGIGLDRIEAIVEQLQEILE